MSISICIEGWKMTKMLLMRVLEFSLNGVIFCNIPHHCKININSTFFIDKIIIKLILTCTFFLVEKMYKGLVNDQNTINENFRI